MTKLSNLLSSHTPTSTHTSLSTHTHPPLTQPQITHLTAAKRSSNRALGKWEIANFARGWKGGVGCVLGKTEQLSRVVVEVDVVASRAKYLQGRIKDFHLSIGKLPSGCRRGLGGKSPFSCSHVPLSGLRIFGLLDFSSLCTLAGCGWGKVEAYACSIACPPSPLLVCWKMQNRLRQ